MGSHTLNYFGIPGRGEMIRLALTVAGVEFTDNTFGFQEWAVIKPDAARFPLGQCPTLQIDDKVLCQSLAILRYLGNEYGLNANDNMGKYQVDMILDTIMDCAGTAAVVLLGFGGFDTLEKKQARAHEVLVERKQSFDYVHSEFGKNNGGAGFLVGDKLTIADLAMTVVLEMYCQVKRSFLDDYPLFKALQQRIRNVPSVKAFYEPRKDQEMTSLLD